MQYTYVCSIFVHIAYNPPHNNNNKTPTKTRSLAVNVMELKFKTKISLLSFYCLNLGFYDYVTKFQYTSENKSFLLSLGQNINRQKRTTQTKLQSKLQFHNHEP